MMNLKKLFPIEFNRKERFASKELFSREESER